RKARPKTDITRRRGGGRSWEAEGIVMGLPSADTTKRLVTPRGAGSPGDRQVPIQPAGHIGQNRLRVEVRKQSMIRSGILSEFPVWLAQPGEEFPAPIRRHHPV